MRLSILYFLIFLMLSCKPDMTDIDRYSSVDLPIFPDYKSCTIPFNLAPLSFRIDTTDGDYGVLFSCKKQSFSVWANQNEVHIPSRKWQDLLVNAKSDSIEVRIIKKENGLLIGYNSFHFYVAEDPIDPYLVYRLIEPGYALWNRMGIYQRNLESYNVECLLDNRQTNNNCVNCHSFCNQNGDSLIFHMRAKLSGTLLKRGDDFAFLDSKNEQLLSSFVYPYWHPSGRFIAFSVNQTTQGFHPEQRVEVYDMASDVLVYDIRRNKVLTSPLLSGDQSFETFPSFSPDGSTLYFCVATPVVLPDSIEHLHYNLCSIAFDEQTGTFGNRIDTLFNAEKIEKSVSFPRVSPDGKFLVCTVSSYGTFPIWHKDADLYMINLSDGKIFCPESINTENAESYHSWSSNSRWMVYSSRQLDGLYTRPFFVHVDEDGNMNKPFLLPQKDLNHYSDLYQSYNIPEFTKNTVDLPVKEVLRQASASPVLVQ